MKSMDLIQQIASQLNLQQRQISAAVELIDDDNTLPFIARYRKEKTGELDEEQLRQIKSSLDSLRALDKRRQTILKSITEQEKLTPELEARINNASSPTELEDLYQPFKPKRRTRASIAQEKGLQGLADLIISQPKEKRPLEAYVRPFLNEAAPTIPEALAGARDIIAESISDNPVVRQHTREKGHRWATIASEKIEAADDARATYQIYYEFQGRVDRLRPHQILALNRGEKEKILRVKLELPERDWRSAVERVFRPDRRSLLAEQLELAIDDAAKRLLLPAIERDIRRALTEQAEAHAISVFAINLRNLLLQPPLVGHTVLGVDPGYRTGCKVALVDPTGKVLATETIYPHVPQKLWVKAKEQLVRLIQHYRVTLVAIGNGTASRETEQLVAEVIQSLPAKVQTKAQNARQPEGSAESVHYLIVNEAGASVYSASQLARAELPDLDVTLRGAVSIARRVQDPLAELVKIDPKSIGIGLYQHDVNQTQLQTTLAGVVESVVNQVGVDVNTASPALLTHIAGIGPKLADNIVAHRDQNGAFINRQALRQVTGLGPKSFEQAAGFLRIHGGDDPLDASAIHPESYPVARAILTRAGLTMTADPGLMEAAFAIWQTPAALERLAAELGTGVPTLADILEQLVKPGRDPREDLPPPILRSDVLNLTDLRPGMRLNGTVRNVVDFGAFVDIGVKQDGLIHRSQLPREANLGVGDIIQVTILDVEEERGRISLGWADI